MKFEKKNKDKKFTKNREKKYIIEERIIPNDTTEKKIQSKSIYLSSFNDRIKAAILWYVRNELFQKIKIVGDEHLETDGFILQEVLKRAEFDKNRDNYHSYIQECRRLIKQTMCSRRGYVKRKIGILFQGKLTDELSAI